MCSNLSEFLFQKWAEYSLESTGELLPINEIRNMGGVGAVAHTVPDGDDPLLVQGAPCRTLIMTYEISALDQSELN
jgi:hypothetical protein